MCWQLGFKRVQQVNWKSKDHAVDKKTIWFTTPPFLKVQLKYLNKNGNNRSISKEGRTGTVYVRDRNEENQILDELQVVMSKEENISSTERQQQIEAARIYLDRILLLIVSI